MGFGDVNFSGVVHVEFSPGSWEEFGHVGFHLGLGYLLGDEEDLGASLLALFSIEGLLSGLLAGGVGDLDGVVAEDVVHNIVLISTEVS